MDIWFHCERCDCLRRFRTDCGIRRCSGCGYAVYLCGEPLEALSIDTDGEAEPVGTVYMYGDWSHEHEGFYRMHCDYPSPWNLAPERTTSNGKH